MGMSEVEFWDCTPSYFALRRRAWLDNRQQMEAARFVAFHVMRSVDTKGHLKRLTDIIRFEWDEPGFEFEPIDKEELEKFSAEADEALKILNPAAYERYMAGQQKKSA